jgi:hypothetical protein
LTVLTFINGHQSAHIHLGRIVQGKFDGSYFINGHQSAHIHLNRIVQGIFDGSNLVNRHLNRAIREGKNPHEGGLGVQDVPQLGSQGRKMHGRLSGWEFFPFF